MRFLLLTRVVSILFVVSCQPELVPMEWYYSKNSPSRLLAFAGLILFTSILLAPTVFIASTLSTSIYPVAIFITSW